MIMKEKGTSILSDFVGKLMIYFNKYTKIKLLRTIVVICFALILTVTSSMFNIWDALTMLAVSWFIESSLVEVSKGEFSSPFNSLLRSLESSGVNRTPLLKLNFVLILLVLIVLFYAMLEIHYK